MFILDNYYDYNYKFYYIFTVKMRVEVLPGLARANADSVARQSKTCVGSIAHARIYLHPPLRSW
jgi:hypothetical protein